MHAGASSSGSSPATARCTIDTGILVSIPQTVADNTYRVFGRVNFNAGVLRVDYEQDSGLTEITTDPADTREDRKMASVAFGSSGEAARTLTGASELNESSASVNLPIGPVAAVASVSFAAANKCAAANATGTDVPGLDHRVLQTGNMGAGSSACKTTLRTGPNGTHSHFELKILNAATPPRGVVSGQVVAVVATLVRGEDSRGATATFASCPTRDGNTGQSCTPNLQATGDDAFTTGSSFFTVQAPSTPGSATLRIQVLPRAGGTETREIPLKFTGPATSIELPEEAPSTIVNRNTDAATPTDATTVAKGTDSIVLKIIPKDANGNEVGQTGAYTYELTGPNSRRVALGGANPKITVGPGPTPSTGDGMDDTTVNQVMIDVTASAADPLMTGEYTLVVKRAARNLSATTQFTVVGPPGPPGDNLDVVKSDDCTNGRSSQAEVGCTFDVTATVTDADGNNVADGTDVLFNARNTDGTSGQYLILGGSGADSSRTTVKTKAGVATAAVTTVGNGEVLIVATTSDGTPAGAVSGTVIVDTTTAASGVGAESNVLACLSKVEVGEYSTYICTPTLTADALFSVLRNRGADAIYLRSVGTWVRYATDASGTPLPGSADNFTAVKYDTLFIGG